MVKSVKQYHQGSWLWRKTSVQRAPPLLQMSFFQWIFLLYCVFLGAIALPHIYFLCCEWCSGRSWFGRTWCWRLANSRAKAPVAAAPDRSGEGPPWWVPHRRMSHRLVTFRVSARKSRAENDTFLYWIGDDRRRTHATKGPERNSSIAVADAAILLEGHQQSHSSCTWVIMEESLCRDLKLTTIFQSRDDFMTYRYSLNVTLQWKTF